MIIKLDNRLIAFLDVLGFSARLERENISHLHEQYSRFIDDAKNATFFAAQGDNSGRKNFGFSQFLFDSIVLVSEPIDDPFNVNNFVSAVSFLMELGFRNKLPLRGAISQGDFVYDESRNIFLSNRFPELAKFELRQEWAGCSVLPHAEKTVIEAAWGASEPQAPTRNQLFHRYPVPVKGSERVNLLVLNFLHFMEPYEIQEGLGYLISPKQLHNRAHFMYLESLPEQRQRLEPAMYPALFMSYIPTRTGFRMKFTDCFGEAAEPGQLYSKKLVRLRKI
ncbi:hypothetical protein AL475_19265 [Vibrio fluvialis]|uniref:hypothetical protein n=1 Tax=Vibrio fluvialis TaxID=676 RepID=UPI000CEB4325|nr:hypothetical protein [Vibrio fluvialis]AVH34030.1 hypothetical protein AL475_19265 [Vibrio fluvialis]